MIVGIGIDAVEISRVERMFADRSEPVRERMLARLFVGDELAYLQGKAHPAQHMAVRLAAKEAAYKALAGNELARGIGWREMEVVSRTGNAPLLRLHGRAEERYRELCGTAIHLSLTHSQTTAVAVVIVER
jgi:holo-[acyl-carrier protein] synthase